MQCTESILICDIKLIGTSSVDWVETSPTRAVAVETSAYALLGFICIDDLQSAYLIANWLNTQRRLGGGFVSTQVSVDEFVEMIQDTTFSLSD